MLTEIAFLGGSYLAGSIPFGLIYSKFFEKEDLRDQGSGNIGATNVIRNFGWTPGILVLALDASKGALPVFAASRLFEQASLVADPNWIWAMAGVAAILGHIYSVFLMFDGGKGVATSAGVFGVLLPKPLLGALVVFAIGVGLTRYMSVGSLSGALFLPLLGGYLHGPINPSVLVAWLLTVMVFVQHRENIQRLINGEEETFF